MSGVGRTGIRVLGGLVGASRVLEGPIEAFRALEDSNLLDPRGFSWFLLLD